MCRPKHRASELGGQLAVHMWPIERRRDLPVSQLRMYIEHTWRNASLDQR
jgi:hypothetical protein